MTATHVANMFLDHRIVPYSIRDHLVADNGPHFVSKFFATLCGFLGVKRLATTAYHFQTNGRVERYNKAAVGRLQDYVAEDQHSWDMLVQTLTYAYNMQVHRSIGVSPFKPVLSRHLSGATICDFSTGILSSLWENESLFFFEIAFERFWVLRGKPLINKWVPHKSVTNTNGTSPYTKHQNWKRTSQ